MSQTSSFTPHYRMLLAGLGIEALDPSAARAEVDAAFLGFLLDDYASRLPFDATFYLANNPDAATAVSRGDYADAKEHFLRRGFREGRLPRRAAFDAAYYAARHPDLAELARQGGPAALATHFLQLGRLEGRAGHPETAAEAERWQRAVARSPAPFAHRTIERALVQAFSPPVLGPKGRGFRGGPVLGETPDDLLLRHRREWEAIDSFPAAAGPVDALDGEYVYGGPICDPFGHAMGEVIHRVLPARTLFDCRQLLFVGAETGAPPTRFGALPAAMQAALRFLDVAPRDVTVIHDHRIVQRLHLVQQGSVLGSGPSEAYLRLLAHYTPARLDALHDGSGLAQRIYVSRSRLRGGLILGERYLEALLEQEGFQILHPQDFALVAQMQAYRHAEIVIFAEGSACHGAELFGIAGLNHCLLLPRRGHMYRHVLDAVLRPRARLYSVLPDAEPLGSVVADGQSGQALVPLGVSVLNLPEVVAALRALGVAKLKRPSLAAYRRSARADFAAYLAYYRASDLSLIDEAAIVALAERAAVAIDGRRGARRTDQAQTTQQASAGHR